MLFFRVKFGFILSLCATITTVVNGISGNAVAGGSSYGVSFNWNRPDTIGLLGSSLPQDDMTVEYWFKNTNPNSDYYLIHSYSAYNVEGFLSEGGEPYEAANEVLFVMAPEFMSVWRGVTTQFLQKTSNPKAATYSNEWRHFAFTIKREIGEVAFYLDGDLLDQAIADIQIENDEDQGPISVAYTRLGFSNQWDVADSTDSKNYLGTNIISIAVVEDACNQIFTNTSYVAGKAALVRKNDACSTYEQARAVADATPWMIIFEEGDEAATNTDADESEKIFDASSEVAISAPVVTLSSEDFDKLIETDWIIVKCSKVAQVATSFTNPVEMNGILHLGQEADIPWGDFDELQSADGILDEYRVWNVARTPEEIKSDYRLSISSEHPQYANLSVYWKFDDEPIISVDGNGLNRLLTSDSSFLGMNKGMMGGLPTVKNELQYLTARGRVPPTNPLRISSTSSPVIEVGNEHTVPYVPDQNIVIELKSFDPDGDDLTTTIKTLPSAGNLYTLDEMSMSALNLLGEGDEVIDLSRNESKRVVFQAPSNFFDDVLFTYTVSDGDTPVEAIVRLIKHEIFQPTNITEVIDEDSLVHFSLALPSQLTQDNMKVEITSLPSKGVIYQAKFDPESYPTYTSIAKTVDQFGEMEKIVKTNEYLNTDKGIVMYQPAKDEFSNSSDSDQVYTSFSYRFVDLVSGIQSEEATVSIVVKAVNDAPVGVIGLSNVTTGSQAIITITITLDSIDVDQDAAESFAERSYAKIVTFPTGGRLYQYNEKGENSRGSSMDSSITEVPQTFAWASKVVRYSAQYSLCGSNCYSWKDPDCTSNDVLAGGKETGTCSETSWHASQILGEPDVYPLYGDAKSGWDFSEENYGHEFIELEYPFDIYFISFELYEVFKPGSLWKISTTDDYIDDTNQPCFHESCLSKTEWTTLWTKPQESVVLSADSAQIFRPPLCPATRKSRLIHLDFDTKRATGWNTIDAARVTGSLQAPPGLIDDSANRLVYESFGGVHGIDKLLFTVSDCLDTGDPTEYSISILPPPAGSFSSSAFVTQPEYLHIVPGDIIQHSVNLTNVLSMISKTSKSNGPYLGTIWQTDALGSVAGEEWKDISLQSPIVLLNLGTKSMEPSRLEFWLKDQSSDLTFCIMLLPRIFVACSNGNIDEARGKCVCSTGRYSGDDCSVELLEDQNELPTAISATGYSLFVILFLVICSATAFIYRYREKGVVKAYQPELLFMILLGCFISSLSIILLQIEGSSVACMMQPWFWSLGFSVTCGAMYAKLFRVYKVFANSARMIRKQVTIKGVLRPVIAMIAANAIVLTLWTILDPLQWTRMIVSEDGYGYVLSSIGQCTSQNELPFILSLGLINAVSMIFALVLSYKVRNIPGEYQEGKYIGFAIFSCIELFLLGITKREEDGVVNY